MKVLKNALGICLLLGTTVTTTFAGELSAVSASEPDKWQYSLFNPTPRLLMRPMSTDRPDKTESLYTVDAGHFQFEADLVSFGINAGNVNR